jgi:hypothetical protein
MVMPAAPRADFVVGEARFALGALQAFFDAVFGLGGAGELGERCFGDGVREVVVGLRHGGLVAVSVADHDEPLFVGTLAPFLVASTDAGLSGILCQAGTAEVVVGQGSIFGMRSSKRIAKWLRASFHLGIGIVHFLEAS